jgi:hypothetical protein
VEEKFSGLGAIFLPTFTPPRRSFNSSSRPERVSTMDGLREKLREFFRQEVRAELRAVAALNNVELITALISLHLVASTGAAAKDIANAFGTETRSTSASSHPLWRYCF